MKRTFPLSRVYSLLEPGPVVMVTTARKGRANIMTMSWHTMIDFDPPIMGCVIISGKGPSWLRAERGQTRLEPADAVSAGCKGGGRKAES